MAFEDGHSLRIDTTKVAHETIDGEVLIINTDSGVYYSLRGVAAELWAAIERAPSRHALVAEALRRYSGDPTAIADGVNAFAARLLEEQVLVLGGAPAHLAELPMISGTSVFSVPEIERFGDMADLLTLDPIHDVDEAGWPFAKQD